MSRNDRLNEEKSFAHFDFHFGATRFVEGIKKSSSHLNQAAYTASPNLCQAHTTPVPRLRSWRGT